MKSGPAAAWLGSALAAAAVGAAYLSYGWRGLALAITVLIFWLLLQFSRAMRALRTAAGRPVGEVPSAVMLNARLSRGMRLSQVLLLTRSLGRPAAAMNDATAGAKIADTARAAAHPAADESFAWTDPGGDTVQVDLRHGRVVAWQLLRSGT